MSGLPRAYDTKICDMSRVAIFGGAFNPVHWGHLLVAQTALTTRQLERVIWVPDRHPPHKSPAVGASFEQRMHALRLALADFREFSAFELPNATARPGYALAIWEQLRERDRCWGEWYWIVGADAFARLPYWYGRERLVPAATWLVAPRELPCQSDRSVSPQEAPGNPGVPSSSGTVYREVLEKLRVQGIEIRAELLPSPAIGISSSLIRSYCRDRRSIRFLVPEAVRAYIEAEGLYLTDKNPGG